MLLYYWWQMVCPPSFVCGHTYGTTEVKKVRLNCFYNFLIWFSRSIINYWKGTLGGFPKFISKLAASSKEVFLLLLLSISFKEKSPKKIILKKYPWSQL